MSALYNDFEEFPCKILKLRIDDGWLPAGEVSSDDVRDVCQKDLSIYNQVHLFAGIGGFPLAARMSGVPDEFRLFTGGFPCQPFSLAGQRRGTQDNRYLWPETLAAFKAHRPDVAVFENVAGLASMGFPNSKTLLDIQALAGKLRLYIYGRKELAVLNKIADQIEEAGYSVQTFIIPACGVDARHKRDRAWIVAIRNDLADAKGSKRNGAVDTRRRRAGFADGGEYVPHANGDGLQGGVRKKHDEEIGPVGTQRPFRLQHCIEGRLRWPIEPDVCRLVNGLSGRVDEIKALGNAIVPQVAAEILSYILMALDIDPEFKPGFE